MDNGKTNTTGDWRIGKNKEFQESYQRPSITEDITKRRLK